MSAENERPDNRFYREPPGASNFNYCPRPWCRGRPVHSLLVHWFGWWRR